MSSERIDSPKSPHFWWIVSVLVVILIILSVIILTNRVIDGEGVIVFISNFALLLSIILSILAIGFTYTSNIQIQGQFDKINNAATNVNDSAHKMEKTANDIVNRIEVVEKYQMAINEKLDNKNIQMALNDSIPSNVEAEVQS